MIGKLEIVDVVDRNVGLVCELKEAINADDVAVSQSLNKKETEDPAPVVSPNVKQTDCQWRRSLNSDELVTWNAHRYSVMGEIDLVHAIMLGHRFQLATDDARFTGSQGIPETRP